MNPRRQGINLAFAQLLQQKGCNVVIADIKLTSEAEVLVSQHSAGPGARVVFVKTDVTAWEDLRNMLDKAVSEFGNFEIVCPGAGIFDPSWSNFWHPPGSDSSRDFVDANHYTTLDVNLTHPIRATQLALQHWLKPENAAAQTTETPKRVVNIASIAGYNAAYPCPMYSAAKHGVIGFTRSLAGLEAQFGIRVNVIAPGIVKTPMVSEVENREEWVDDEKDAFIAPEDVAEAMLQLVESEDHPGGTVLEILVGTTRQVTAVNDPGSSRAPGAGTSFSNVMKRVEAINTSLKDGSWLKN